MGTLTNETEPAAAGFDAGRLQRISDHFKGYVDDSRLPGWSLAVARDGKVVHTDNYGMRDVEAGLPVEPDTVFRIYSMTKAITTVAAMILYEEGHFRLREPVSAYIPAFANQQVYRSGSSANPTLEPVTSPMEIWHLMSHTSGLTYGFAHAHPVDAIYREAGFEWGSPPGATLEECVDLWAGLPLLFQPGSEWCYSVATDVLGSLVEVVSGQSLDVFLKERILDPLGMTDTAFFADDGAKDRLAALYTRNPADGTTMRIDAMGAAALSQPTMLSGGGGLVSTMHDYNRFTSMLLNNGSLDGERILGSRTVRYMATNHLPGNADLTAFGRPLFSETDFDGVGFGLGFSVVVDPAATKVLCSPGEFAWGGAASTAFWVDPVERITALFMTQLLPSSTYPIRPELKQLVYQALVD